MGARAELRWTGSTADGVTVGIASELSTVGRRQVKAELTAMRVAITEARAAGVESAPAIGTMPASVTAREVQLQDLALDGLSGRKR